ncbi:hypothetical protein [Polymorphospora sp. NPDC050346]|uniref:hypothetical protein n=1 Tax=Polymorphospora sp. NPDC050346 TaxID=3155780 RepID=UPI0033F0A9E9
MTLSPGTEASEQLLAHARLLASCRDIYLSAWAERLCDVRADSRAHRDIHQVEQGPGGPWPGWLVPQTRNMAVKLVRQQADFCVSMGVLVEQGEFFEPIYSLARSAFEFGLRAYWLLDVDADLRQRCARGRLMELVSVHHLRDAARDRPDVAERRAELDAMKRGWKNLKGSVSSMFADVVIDGDPSRWSIEGARYESWTDVAERWLARGRVAMSGGGLYKHLSVRTHPQGFNATQGFGVSAEGVMTRSTNATEVSRLACVVLLTFYLSLTLVASYHGLASQAVKQMEGEIANQFPGVFK